MDMVITIPHTKAAILFKKAHLFFEVFGTSYICGQAKCYHYCGNEFGNVLLYPTPSETEYYKGTNDGGDSRLFAA
jgi:hypothetical protein